VAPDHGMILPPPVRQLYVHRLLAAARETVLADVVLDVLGRVDPDFVAVELRDLAPQEPRRLLAAAGVRDELVFATPTVLTAQPTTLGYYRLLLGVSQKQMYRADTGMSQFRSMESRNTLAPKFRPQLPTLCRAMNHAMAELITTMDGGITQQDVHQLPLLMLGAQLDGSWRTRIGQAATRDVFESLKQIIKDRNHTYVELGDSLTLTNRADRTVTIALAADPDVVITEETPEGKAFIKVAIEIKGGTDQSNAHNRAGEAEKSHQKVRHEAQDFWTIISTKNIDMQVLKQESPTTRHWFDLQEVQEKQNPTWQTLTDNLLIAMGI
jgi:XcyI-like restriction endonuclease